MNTKEWVMLQFNSQTVKTLSPDKSSPQLNQAVLLANDWLNRKENFIFHTSGSTGIPKKIILTRSQLEASASATIKTLQLNKKENVFVCLNTHLIAGAMMIVRGLVLGCEIFIVDPTSDPLKLLSDNHVMTFSSFVPMQLHHLLEGDSVSLKKLNRFKNILVGGASINRKLEEKFSQLECRCFHTYGMTETVSHIALREIGKEKYFTSMEGVELKKDENNCLQIRSPSTKNDWIKTNDVVELITEKQFSVLGRSDEVINTGGIKIFPQRIESALEVIFEEMNLRVTEFFVASEPDEVLGERLVVIL
ncbi:MAG: AMP-binding protein, partial [Bacteroidia bacterium]